MSNIWLVTGISGSGRIELLNNLHDYAKDRGKKVSIYDVGCFIRLKANENGIAFKDDLILSIDQQKLSLLRALAIQEIKERINADHDAEIVFIGMHALFQWKNSLIPGVSYSDLMSIQISGVINVVDDIVEIYRNNKNNPKWNDESMLSVEETQRWMMEEELLSSTVASIKRVPFFVQCKQQKIENLYSFFFTEKKRIYLSFPITAIRGEKELETIQNTTLPELQELFFVFNPLDIKDKTHLSQNEPLLGGDLNARLIDARTVSRDFQFISQSDAVVVLYPTEKQSPGVAAEINFAQSYQIPVYMYYFGKLSPFLTAAAEVYPKKELLMNRLRDFAKGTDKD